MIMICILVSTWLSIFFVDGDDMLFMSSQILLLILCSLGASQNLWQIRYYREVRRKEVVASQRKAMAEIFIQAVARGGSRKTLAVQSG